MTTAGLAGGLGPETTVDYYRRILAAWQEHDPSTAPHLVIDSIDVKKIFQFVEYDRPALADYLSASVDRLARAGADFAAITANMPHLAFSEVALRSPIPLISIIATCADAAEARGAQRLALLGTRFTMDAPMYPAELGGRGIIVVTPNESERVFVHDHYVGELLQGKFRPEVRERIEAIVARLRDEEGVDGVILGGTELALLLPSATVAEVPAFNTTALHVEAIVKRLRE